MIDFLRRSTAETAVNPIGQAFPVIDMHLVGNSEQTPRGRTIFSLSVENKLPAIGCWSMIDFLFELIIGFIYIGGIAWQIGTIA